MWWQTLGRGVGSGQDIVGLEPVSEQTGFRTTGKTSLWELSEAPEADHGQGVRSPFKHVGKSRPLIVFVNMASFTCMSYWGWWHLGYNVTTHNYPNIFGCIPSIIFMHTFELLILDYIILKELFMNLLILTFFWDLFFHHETKTKTNTIPVHVRNRSFYHSVMYQVPIGNALGRQREMPAMGGRAQLPRYNSAQLKLNFRYTTNSDLV